MSAPEKRYLGDGVYVAFDGYGLVLTTEDGGPRPTNSIYLELEVWAALEQYVERLKPCPRHPDYPAERKGNCSLCAEDARAADAAHDEGEELF